MSQESAPEDGSTQWIPPKDRTAPPHLDHQHPLIRWLVDPKNRKPVLGGAGFAVAALLILTGSGVAALLGVALAVGVWVKIFHVAPSDTASFCFTTRLDPEEIAGLAAEAAAGLTGPFTKVSLQSATVDRLEFVVTGVTARPLEFHADMVPGDGGGIAVSTAIDTWTKNRVTLWFIPIPFSSTIDGFRLYKKFGDRWSDSVTAFDPQATADYLQKS